MEVNLSPQASQRACGCARFRVGSPPRPSRITWSCGTRCPSASWVSGRTLSSGDGRQTASIPLSQPIGLPSRPPTLCAAARGSGKLGLHSELRSFFGLPSKVGTGPPTGGGATDCKLTTDATFATKTQRLLTTSWPHAHSRVRFGGPYSRSLVPTHPW
jgi:hypothetical protein